MGALYSKNKTIEAIKVEEENINIKPLILLRQELMCKLFLKKKIDYRQEFERANKNKEVF